MNLSIIIPAINTNHLKKCLYFLNKNSYYKHEVLVHINYTTKEVYEEFKNYNYDNFSNYVVSFSTQNLGISIPVNRLVKKSTNEFILYLNDDEFCFKDWDYNFVKYVNNYTDIRDKMFTLRRVEPINRNINNTYYSGLSVDILEHELEFELSDIKKYTDYSFNNPSYRKSVVPTIIRKQIFLELGGYDEDLYPGGGTDSFFGYMFVKKYGLDNLILLPYSLVYHFSERRGTENVTYPMIKPITNEYELFQRKHGITMAEFDSMLMDCSNCNLSISQVIDVAFSTFNIVQDREEITWMAEKVKELRPEVIVEIGTERGGSMFVWDSVGQHPGLRICIDMCDGTTKQFRENAFRKAGTLDNIQFIEGNSHTDEVYNKLIELLRGCKIDYLFIDGDHSYEGVKQDFEKYSPLVRDGGYVGFHDVIESDENKRTNTLVFKFWQELPNDKKQEKIVDGKDIFGVGLYRK